jgi:DNA repair photolyase
MSGDNRTLYAASRECPFDCVYCFAKFKHFAADSGLGRFSDSTVDKSGIIYPTCDGEFFCTKGAIAELEDFISRTHNKILISVSVKSKIGNAQLEHLKKANDLLVQSGRGLVKCSVSFSTKHKISEYEVNAASYAARVENVRLLYREKIPNSINLKPLLPFVGAAEYAEIIKDTAPYSRGGFLVGGLYLDLETDFGKSVVTRFPQFIQKRRVEWLPRHPEWVYCEDPDQLLRIRRSIAATSRPMFETDVDVMQYLAKEFLGNGIRRSSNQHLDQALAPAE